jgi:hypothetical protein
MIPLRWEIAFPPSLSIRTSHLFFRKLYISDTPLPRLRSTPILLFAHLSSLFRCFASRTERWDIDDDLWSCCESVRVDVVKTFLDRDLPPYCRLTQFRVGAHLTHHLRAHSTSSIAASILPTCCSTTFIRAVLFPKSHTSRTAPLSS